MTGMTTMTGGPMTLAMAAVWLLVAAFLLLGIAALVKYLRESPQR